MGDSSAGKMKIKRNRNRVSNTSLNPEEIKEGDFTPALVRCSSSYFHVASNTNEGTSSSLTKKLIFWGKDLLGGKISCFIVDICMDHPKLKPTIDSAFDHQIIHTGEKLTPSIPNFSFTLENTHVPLFCNTFATLGSFLYSFGGLFNRDYSTSETNLVHYFDTLNPENGSWKPSPPMITCRENPQVIIANGNIYVFGCFGSDKCRHNPSCVVWAECFDSSTREWTPLPVPTFRENLIVCSSIPKNKNHVIKKISALVDHELFYEFHIKTNSWTCISNNEKNFTGIISHPAMFNKVLYWFGEDVRAYDILKDRNFEGHVQDLSFQRAMRKPLYVDLDFDDGDIRPTILHLGGRYFCLLGSLPDLEEHDPMRIHCLIIKVSTTNECYKMYPEKRRDISKFFLGAHVIACQSFPIDRQLYFLDGRLMMI